MRFEKQTIYDLDSKYKKRLRPHKKGTSLRVPPQLEVPFWNIMFTFPIS